MKSELFQSYYEVLRVSPQAPVEVISAAYRALMATLRKHPDLGGHPDEAVLINEAYEILKDPEKRRRYDARLPEETKGKRERTEERRRAPRRPLNATISYCLKQDHRWYAARVRDASTSGLRLVAREPLGRGQQIVIASSNPASQAITAVIRWSHMTHPSLFERLFEAGVEFEREIPDVERHFRV